MPDDLNELLPELERYFLEAGIGLSFLTIIPAPVIPSGESMLADPGVNGFVVRTSLNTTTARVPQGSTGEISIANADGVSGNPLFSLPAILNFVGKSLNIADSGFVLQSVANSTKKATFDLSNIAASTTIVLSVPSITDTLLGALAVQTISNKTISGSANTLTNISESSFAFTDVTVNNASSSKHGLLPKLTNTGTLFLRDDGQFASPSGSGDVSSNTSVSVDGEGVVFNGATGKSLKRVTGSGFGIYASGILTVSNLSATIATAVSDKTGTGSLVFATSPTLNTPIINSPAGLNKNDVGLNLVDNTSDSTKNSAVATLTNKSISGASNTLTSIAEGSLSFTDITTNNVNTFRHGLMPKLPGSGTAFFRDDGVFTVPAGGGDVASNTSVSVASEIALFLDTTGKVLKRSTGTGIAILTSGVLSTIATSAGLAGALSDETGTGSLVFNNTPSLTSPNIITPTGITKSDVGLSNVDNTSDATKQTAISTATLTFTNKRILPRYQDVADGTSFTPDLSVSDVCIQSNTQATGTLTINAPIGGNNPTESLIIRIKSTNQQTFAWNAIYRGGTTQSLPTASTGGGKTDYFIFKYHGTDGKYDCLSASFGY